VKEKTHLTQLIRGSRGLILRGLNNEGIYSRSLKGGEGFPSRY
jgi:hypothetical protein